MFARKVFVISAALAAVVSAAPSPSFAGKKAKANAKAKSTATAGKEAKPKRDVYAVDANTPGTDSDEWRTADAVLGGADRIEGNEADKNLVAFTFDDGPDKNTTPLVLDALDRYNIPAAFFIVTQRIVGKHGEIPRQLLEREHKAGHLIGSHSVTHKHLGKASGDVLDKEVDGSLRTLVRITGRHIGLFRPPFGALSKEGKNRVSQRGLTNTLWSIDTLDWQAKSGDKLRAKVVKMILADKGGVVLMHDVKKITSEVVAGIFDDLEADNCAKLAAGQPPIIPVTLHYFLKRGKESRAIPADVAARTEAYRKELPNRCAKRPAVAPAAKPAAAAPVAVPARPATAAPGVSNGVIPVTPPR